jgi:4-phytase / acid phosphatase
LSKIGVNALLLLCSFLLPSTAFAQEDSSVARQPAGRHLRLVVILARHGVRSPTWTQARLDSYSSLPWPPWDVPPGYLTSRGFDLVKRLGAFDRASLAADGLLPNGCADSVNTFVWADTDQRTRESGRALAEGLFPGCPPPVHTAAGAPDPLFHPPASTANPARAKAAYLALEAKVGQPDAQQTALLAEMQHVLLGCDPKGACAPARVPAIPFLGAATAIVHSKGDHIADLEGPLALSASFAEDFLLEYADGMPMDQVGWGHVDEAQLRRFLVFHSESFELMHRTSGIAALEASNMLLRIERTLEQRADGKPLPDAIGPPGSKLVIIDGHDTNIAGVAALLGLHWNLDGRDDDTPPGTQLAFELWQDNRGIYGVRVRVTVQTLRQLREMQDLTLASPPARATVTPAGCSSLHEECSWLDFRGMIDRALNQENPLTPGSN